MKQAALSRIHVIVEQCYWSIQIVTELLTWMFNKGKANFHFLGERQIIIVQSCKAKRKLFQYKLFVILQSKCDK